ncbi:ATPase, partial [Klebsiella pneumoniae]|nr:ATPase [Klebsiella pneumoniae]
IAQLYDAAIHDAPHTQHVRYMTTLSGYVHWYLTGERVLGVGDASGMFPIDPKTHRFREDLLNQFNDLYHKEGYTQDVYDVLPKVLVAGEDAGYLTETGAKLIDPNQELQAGCPM